LALYIPCETLIITVSPTYGRSRYPERWGDRSLPGLGERAAGAGDSLEAQGDRAAERAEADHHPPRRHLRHQNFAISRLEREIDLLREYRTRLVADVVTGKLDVREAAATLPDEDPLRAFAASRDPDPDLETPDDEEDP